MTQAVEETEAHIGKSSSAIGKGFAVLEALRKQSPMTLTALAAATGMAPSSAHSIVNQLLEVDAVTQDEEKRYQLGPVLMHLGASYARSTSAYRSVWIELVTTANELSVTAALAVPWDGYHLVLNSHRAAKSDVAVPYGGRVPLDAASWGKVYYAVSGEPLPKELKAYTPSSIVDRAEFEQQVRLTKSEGYATDNEEFREGVAGVCAALTSQNGYEGLISFLGPKPHIEELRLEWLGQRLATLAARASLTMGDGSRLRFFSVE